MFHLFSRLPVSADRKRQPADPTEQRQRDEAGSERDGPRRRSGLRDVGGDRCDSPRNHDVSPRTTGPASGR